jgi:hypothetical protein
VAHGAIAMTSGSSGAGPDATIAQIVAVVLPDFPPLDGALRDRVRRDVTAYVTRQVSSQPAFMRLPLRLALLGFQLLPILRHGRRFGALSPAQRAAYLAWWSAAPLSPMRDLVKLIRGSALWVYFDHTVVTAHLEAESPGG